MGILKIKLYVFSLVYVVQLDTQCPFMVEFIHNIYQLYNVSNLTGPSSAATFKSVWADW
jgi:hypothetical protein